ncbi:FtsX-like permease family protein [Parabacteroides sp. Marseille-P3160]|uniref:FtsX-like permease family protein n=1 Tax=Parabacteroides sp. Marseille-P3160 TaxID=1917887 RepID=UPI0009BB3101|nr:FtsX-like permease family protein [Parabacteroides sp. Marseille-P3160]
MNLSFYIARRYLFAKKSHNAINIISMVAVCGVVIATAALVCALSIFNGFRGLVSDMFSSFDPELKVVPVSGKVFDPTADAFRKVKELPEVSLFCETLQENALLRYQQREEIVTIKGVDSTFHELAQIDSAIFDGRFALQEGDVSYATLGIGVASTLGVNAGFVSPLEMYAPKRDEKVNVANVATSLSVEYAYIGGVFCINQAVYDDNYVLIPLAVARSLFHYEKEVSSVELKIRPEADLLQAKRKIADILGKEYDVLDRYEQQADSFKMMEVEKGITYLILCFILMLATFNVVGSLSMLMLEKRADVEILRTMGANERLIHRIFLFEGWLISIFGAIIGLLLGVGLCLLQQKYGLIKLGQSGSFITDAYPVQVEISDLITTFLTVLFIGFISAWYPVRHLSKKWFRKD